MRVAVVGQGSIGTRHAELLLELGCQVVAFDPDPHRGPVPGVERAATLDASLLGADAAIIASPSSAHASQARQVLERRIPVLVEKPPATDLPRVIELECLAAAREVPAVAAMNLRHHAGVKALAELLSAGVLGRVLRASAWCGSWLPGWRPGADYRSTYSARAALGGGVLLDVAIHELDYLLWLLGPAVAVTALTRRVSSLELDVEDVAVIALELASGVLAELVVDYFDRSYHRGCRVVGENGTLDWNWEQERLTVHLADGPPRVQEVSADVGSGYRAELEQFLSLVRGEPASFASLGEARQVLAVIEAARASSRDGRCVSLPGPLVLRRAESGDLEELRRWRNDPETRRWSRSTGEVSPEEHAQWFERTMADPAAIIWIAQDGGSGLVGQVRVTRESPDAAELHVTLAPEARGRGLGALLIMEAAARILVEPGIDRLLAHVKDGNRASRRAFERAGFTAAGRDETGLQRFERRPSTACIP